MTTIGWISEKEKKGIQKISSHYKKANNKARANVIDGMLCNLDWFQASIAYKLNKDSFRSRMITKADYETLQGIYSLYREMIQILLQDGSLMRSREINEKLIRYIFNYNVCRFLQIERNYDTERMFWENDIQIQDCSSLTDILLMGVEKSFPYKSYVEFVEIFLNNLHLRRKMEVDTEAYVYQQDQMMLHNPQDVLERHPEHVNLYDSKTLMQVKMDILNKLGASKYSLQDENLVLDTIKGINSSLIRERK